MQQEEKRDKIISVLKEIVDHGIITNDNTVKGNAKSLNIIDIVQLKNLYFDKYAIDVNLKRSGTGITIIVKYE